MVRDVVWITLESVRQDRTSLDSRAHGHDTTPNLRQIGAAGRVFPECHSHDIWTRSSSASMLTGHAPSAHQTWTNEAKLPEDIRTIPEAFSDAGYKTVCVSPNAQLSEASGLDRGFDHFHYLSTSTLLEEVTLSTLAKWALQVRGHGGGLTADGRQHCKGYFTNELAKEHIETGAAEDTPLFMYLHYGDTHHPYVPPLGWRDRFDDDIPLPINDAIDLALDMTERLYEYIAMDEPFSAVEWRTLEALYDTTLAYVDHLVGQLVEHARAALDDPIVVITADHAELFDEAGLLAHMLTAHTAVSNVPMVVTGLEPLPSDGLIQPADIMLLICDDLGIDHPVPIGHDIRATPREFAVTQRGGARARNKLETITEHDPGSNTDRFHLADLTSLRTQKWRYQKSAEGSELFSLHDESVDVRGANPEQAGRLDDKLEAWLEDVGQPVGRVGQAEFDEDMQQQLRDMGYLQ